MNIKFSINTTNKAKSSFFYKLGSLKRYKTAKDYLLKESNLFSGRQVIGLRHYINQEQMNILLIIMLALLLSYPIFLKETNNVITQ